MKKRYFFFSSGAGAVVDRHFIIQINSGADSQFTIPTTGVGYNYKVSTSDGQSFTGVTGNLIITFPDANTLYDVSISGDFPRIYFNNGTQRLKLVDIKQWGDIEWTSMELAFQGCSNMKCSATDTPNVSSVTNMFGMFAGCTSLTTLDVSNWNVSSVTDMVYMFYDCTSLTTLDVSNWNVSSVTNMYQMFYQCTLLTTLDVSNWNVSSVTDMNSMFYNCSFLTTLDVSTWNVSSVTNMGSMFYLCSSLTTLDVSTWDVSSVTNMYAMFISCSSLTTLDVSSWDVSSVTTMYWMFYNCSFLTTLDVSNWNVSSVTNMFGMFGVCTSLTTLDVSTWNVSSVTDMNNMFYQCTSLTTLDVSNWNVSSVTDMQQMFYACTSLEMASDGVLDFSSPIKGSISVRNISALLGSYHNNYTAKLIKELYLQCGNVVSEPAPFYGELRINYCEKVLLINMGVSMSLRANGDTTKTSMDKQGWLDLVSSIRDMTGQSSPTVTLPNNPIFTNDNDIVNAFQAKNWTVII